MLFDETDDPLVMPTSTEERKRAEREARRQLREEARLQRKQRRKHRVDADGDAEMSESGVYDDDDSDDRDDEMDEDSVDEEEEEDEDDDMDDDGDGMEYDEDDLGDRTRRRRRGFAKMGASTHAFASAGLLYALSTKINKDTNEYLWNGILGITDQLIHQRIDRRRYLLNLSHFRNEVARLNLEDEEINTGRGSNATDRIVRSPGLDSVALGRRLTKRDYRLMWIESTRSWCIDSGIYMTACVIRGISPFV